MERERGGIPGSSNQAQRGGNAKRKDGRSAKLTSTRNVKEVQKFLGLANYYRRFIKDFAKLAAPLHMLVRKEQKWKWEKEQEEAFGKLKRVFTMEPVLAIPDIDREMRVEMDALDYATGGVLSLKCEDGKWRPVAFISKLLNATERNYEIMKFTTKRCWRSSDALKYGGITWKEQNWNSKSGQTTKTSSIS